jgi:ribosomal protein S18 acetylase RimI-like enzyme
MPDLSFDPPVTSADSQGFVQTVRLTDGQTLIGQSRWHVAGDGRDGVVQILELAIATEHRRAGHGKRLWDATMDQVRRYFKAGTIRPRRVWINVEQKQQVVGRAFLTQLGFHHVATLPTLLKDQDAMVYLLSLD